MSPTDVGVPGSAAGGAVEGADARDGRSSELGTVRRRLTTRGRIVLGGAGAAVLLSFLAGGGVASVAAPLGALALGALAASWTRFGSIAVEGPGHFATSVGRVAPLPLLVRHEGRFGTLCDVEIAAGHAAGDGAVPRPLAVVAALRPGEERRVPAAARFARRGEFDGLPLRLRTSAPFGLVETTKTVRLRTQVLVGPRVLPVRRAGADAVHQGRSRDARARRGAEVELYALREWRAGESQRHVHWPLSAKRGRLLRRELRGEDQPPVRVVLDARATSVGEGVGRRDRRVFESAVTLAVSLVRAHARAGREVSFDVYPRPHRARGRLTRRGRDAAARATAVLANVRPVRTKSGVAAPGGGPETVVEPRTRVEVVTDGRGRRAQLAEWTERGAHVLDVRQPEVRALLQRRGRRGTAPVTGGPAPVPVAVPLSVALFGVAAFAAVGGALGTLPAPALMTLLCGVAALSAVAAAHAATSRALCARLLRRSVSRLGALSNGPAVDAGAGGAQVPRGTRARVGRIALAAALSLPLTLLFGMLAALGAQVAARGPSRRPAQRPVPPQPSAPGSGVRESLELSVDRHGSGITLPPYEVVMTVEPRDGSGRAGDLGSLLLRGVAYAEFDRRGPVAARGGMPTRLRDADDGAADGWTHVAPVPTEQELVTLHVSQYEMSIPGETWQLLFAPAEAVAFGLPEVRHDPRRFTVLASSPGERYEYDVLTPPPGAARRPQRDAVASSEAWWSTSLPPPSPALERISEKALEITSGARRDVERVERVRRFLTGEFEYSLEVPGFVGPDGVAALLDRGEGYCTQFASAAVLMLRSLNVPARVVSGFLVQEFDPEGGVYRVRHRDTHAWIEVHFEGLGWVPYDVTPPDVTRVPAAAGAAPSSPGTWGRDLAEALDRVLRGGDRASMRAVWAVLRSVPKPLLLALLGISVLAQLAWLFRRARKASARRSAAPGPSPAAKDAAALFRRVEQALARKGVRRARSQTRRELAAAAAPLLAATDAAALEAIAAAVDAATFGDHPLSPETRATVRSLVSAL